MKKTKLIAFLTGASAILTVVPLAITACSRKKQEQGEFNIDDSKVVKTINGELGNEYARYCDVDYTGFELKNADVNDIEAQITDISATTITASDITISTNNDGTFGVHARFTADYFLYNTSITFKMTIAQKSKPENKKTIEGFSLRFGVCEWAVETDSNFSRIQTLVTKQTKLSYMIDGGFSVVNGIDKVTDFADFYVDVYSKTTATATADIIQTEDAKFGIILNLESLASNGQMHFILCIKHKQYPNWYSPIDLIVYSTDDYSYGFDYKIVGTTNACITKCNIHDDNIVIPETLTTTTGTKLTVTQLNGGIFKNKYNLKSVTIPKTVTAINSSTSGLFTGTIVEDVIVADDNTKYTSKDSNKNQCHCLMDIDRKTIIAGTAKTAILGTVTSIGSYAFDGLYSLENIIIPENVTKLGKYAFRNCKQLTAIKLPTKVTNVPECCFDYCTSLKTVNLENVLTYGIWAFGHCESLTDVVISAKTTEFPGNPFAGSSNLKTIKTDGPLATGANYTSKDANGNECNYIMDKLHTKLCCGTPTSKIISTITTIRSHAFYAQDKLETITIPSTVTIIEKNAFWGCSKLSTIDISGISNPLGTGAFENCTSLTSIKLHDNIKEVPANCFAGCTNLKTLTVKEITKIGSRGFAGCSSLAADIKFGTNLTIGSSAFANCTLLKTVDFSSTSITAIPESCFKGCSSLTSVKLDNACVTLGKNAFAYCLNLPSIDISKVKTIGDSAFEGCLKLGSIALNAAVNKIGARTFYYCSSMPTITIPAAVKTIGESAFEGCKALSGITWDGTSTLTTIGENAFFKCESLGAIAIPASVTTINAYAFGETAITSATFKETTKEWKYTLTEEVVEKTILQDESSAAELLLAGIALTRAA